MSGGSINHELLQYYYNSENTPPAAAFVQQRSKNLPEAFESLFHSFVENTTQKLTFKGYRLFAIDGSDLHIPTNPTDKNSYFQKINDQRPYNLLPLNALFDICEQTYVDALIQKARVSNENQSLIDMIERNKSESPVIVIADRGYKSYNALAHIQEKGWNFLFRIKGADSKGGIANGLILPDCDEYDLHIDLHLSAGRTQEHWQLYKEKNTYKRISHPVNFDYFIAPDGFRDIYTFYHLPFRILKIQLSDDIYETVITNLPADTFSKKRNKTTIFNEMGHRDFFSPFKISSGSSQLSCKKSRINIPRNLYSSNNV